jgi:hypothetical protein
MCSWSLPQLGNFNDHNGLARMSFCVSAHSLLASSKTISMCRLLGSPYVAAASGIDRALPILAAKSVMKMLSDDTRSTRRAAPSSTRSKQGLSLFR